MSLFQKKFQLIFMYILNHLLQVLIYLCLQFFPPFVCSHSSYGPLFVYTVLTSL